MMDRRTFLAGSGAVLLAAPLAAQAQQAGKVWQIGYLSPAASHNPIDEAFERSLKALGYVEGQNVHLERRYTRGQTEQFAGAVADVIRHNVDLIVVWGPAGSLAAKNATETIPVVFLAGGTGIARDVVASLPRPGRNVTGITFIGDTAHVSPKHLQLLKDLLPQLSHAATIRTEGEDTTAGEEALRAAAKSLGIRLTILSVRGPEDLKAAFASIEKAKPQALIAAASSLVWAYRREVIEFSAKNRLPAMYGFREMVPEGGLMSLSPSLTDIAVRGAFYVDKILKGAKPADLPVEQPTKFEFVINAKTAKALGLTIPQSLLLRADQVIE